jgi:C_GCAxxG_C_C family probable redox protein
MAQGKWRGKMSLLDDTVKMFEDGFNCSQAVCATYGKQFGVEKDIALRIASGFGGGIGRMGDTCGAVTGAIMVIGLKYGLTEAGDKESKEITIAKVNEFVEQFKKKNSSIICRDLLGYDLSKPEDRKVVSEKGLTKITCPDFVRDAAGLLEKIIK